MHITLNVLLYNWCVYGIIVYNNTLVNTQHDIIYVTLVWRVECDPLLS